MKFSLTQWNIIQELVSDEANAVNSDYTNKMERFKKEFPDEAIVCEVSEEYEAKNAEIQAVKARLSDLNQLLEKLKSEKI